MSNVGGNKFDYVEGFDDISILLVDDERANVLLLKKMLKLHGYSSVVEATDSREVLGLCLKQDFDLILLDLNMPYLDGYEVMAQLKEAEGYEPPPILVLTAQIAQEYCSRALVEGARDYVRKPFEHVELLARVRNLLEVRVSEKRLRSQNQELESRVRARTQELHDSQLEVVRRLGRAAEYRDNETGMHILRMSKVSELLARAMNLDDARCDLILNASPMHDIGKIGIPDSILLKPGRFEPDEWEFMKTHSQIGADILSGDDSELMKMAREIALSHHEKWDGSGYPAGLAGQDIPLVGRIVAVADVFDALTSERPYKKAWKVDDAIVFMQEQSGKHFDPVILELFMGLLDEVLSIREKYCD